MSELKKKYLKLDKLAFLPRGRTKSEFYRLLSSCELRLGGGCSANGTLKLNGMGVMHLKYSIVHSANIWTASCFQTTQIKFGKDFGKLCDPLKKYVF